MHPLLLGSRRALGPYQFYSIHLLATQSYPKELSVIPKQKKVSGQKQTLDNSVSMTQSLVSRTPSQASFSFWRKAKNSGLQFFWDRLITGDGNECSVPKVIRWNW